MFEDKENYMLILYLFKIFEVSFNEGLFLLTFTSATVKKDIRNDMQATRSPIYCF